MDRDKKGRFVKGSKVNLGRKHSEETIKKLSESHKGKILPEEQKEKIGKALKGRIISEKQKKQISEANLGKNNGMWNGGRIKNRGYILILTPNHPLADKYGYVREHRLVMEKFLGRYLKPEEVIHHINENKSDNRLENLMLFANEGEHRKYHHRLKKVNLCLGQI